MSIRQIGSGALSVFGIMGLALALISLVEPMVEASDCLRYALQGSVALSQKIHSLILIWTGIRLSSEVITYTLAMFFMFALAATSSGGTHASVHFSEFFSAKMSNNKERHAAMAIFAIIVINCAIALSVFFAKAPSGSFYNLIKMAERDGLRPSYTRDNEIELMNRIREWLGFLPLKPPSFPETAWSELIVFWSVFLILTVAYSFTNHVSGVSPSLTLRGLLSGRDMRWLLGTHQGGVQPQHLD